MCGGFVDAYIEEKQMKFKPCRCISPNILDINSI